MRAALPAVVLLTVLLSGCGTLGGSGGGSGEGPGGTDRGTDGAPEVDGRVFLSTGVTREGEPSGLVDGTRVRISFADGRVSVQAGCNTLFGGYRVEDGVLRVDAMGGTEMGCPEELMAQDTWLAELLEAGPGIAVDGDTLTLSGESAVLTLQDREVADPDRPLVGTVWRVDGLVSGDAVSSVPGGAQASLTLADDGTLAVHTGCNQGSGGYQLQDDGQTLVVGTLAMTLMACDDERGELESAVLGVLRAPELTVEITADTLTLSAPDGQALVLREE